MKRILSEYWLHMSILLNFAQLLHHGVVTPVARLRRVDAPGHPSFVDYRGGLLYRVWTEGNRPGLLVRLNPEVQTVRAEDNCLLTGMLAARDMLQAQGAEQNAPAPARDAPAPARDAPAPARDAMEIDSDSDSDEYDDSDSDSEGPPPLIRADGSIAH